MKAQPELIPNMVAEIIRWQTPLAHMRRTVKEDLTFQGQSMKAGDKVVMWYVSGNRDERAFEDPDRLMIDRSNARGHVSFGYGVHRCMNWLECVAGAVGRASKAFRAHRGPGGAGARSARFQKGYASMQVMLHPKARAASLGSRAMEDRSLFAQHRRHGGLRR